MARGRWQGGEFDTGHRENGTLATINWFGKTFISATDAKPLICLDADGNKYANTDNGEASLWMAEFRGEVTATMVFDGQPVHDHFKKIDDNAVMGIMNGKNALDDVAGVDLGHLGAPQAGLGGQPHHQCDAASNMSAPTTTSAPMRSPTGTNSNALQPPDGVLPVQHRPDGIQTTMGAEALALRRCWPLTPKRTKRWAGRRLRT